MVMEQNKKFADHQAPMSILMQVFWTGLFGGIFWSVMGYFAHLFSFTEIHPHVILEPWAYGDWKTDWLGTVISIIIYGLLSIGAAFIFYAAFKKSKGIWPGVGFGIVLFLLVFIVLNPLLPGIDPLNELNRNTILTTICLYMVYGIFIGYSINYQYQIYSMTEKEPTT